MSMLTILLQIRGENYTYQFWHQYMAGKFGTNVQWSTLVRLVGPLGEDTKNISEPSPPIYDHANTTGHSIKSDSFSIVGMESQGINRTIRGAVFIRVNALLNRNLGKYQLPQSGMGCCRISQLCVYNDPLHSTSSP